VPPRPPPLPLRPDPPPGARGGPGAAGVPPGPGHHRPGVGARLPVGHRAARPPGHAAGGRGGRPMTLPETPSQTIRPFFAVGLPWPDGPDVVADGTPGALWIGGLGTDGAGGPLPHLPVRTRPAPPR